MRPLSPVVALLVSVALVTAVPCLLGDCVHAQPARTWIHLDEYPDGTPATVELFAEESSSQVTRFTLTIHGFWVEPVVGPDQRTYQRYKFPGLGVIGQEGAPDFPKLVLRIAVPTTAQEATLRSAVIGDQRVYQNILPYPMPDPGVEDGPEEWRYDQKLYDGPQRFPLEHFPATTNLETLLNQIPGADLEVYPVQWDPVSRELHIIEVVDIAYDHEGPIRNTEAMTRHRARLANRLFRNWPVVDQFFPVDTTEYVGSFLFIYPAAMADSIAALVEQKRERGFHVTEMTTESIGDDCWEFRGAIGNWHSAVEARGDAYCLLVGDHEDIPLCTVLDGETIYTDDTYASPSSPDLHEEIFVGRLSVNDAAELATMVRKILAYENHGTFGAEYHEALLVAHLEDAPGRYQGCCEAIRTSSYSTPPSFLTCYGFEDASNSDIRHEISLEVGVVAYRGHANSSGWAHWNTWGGSYYIGELPALMNVEIPPVVWSITCSSGNIRSSDCFGEAFMLGEENRAVAFYGATAPSAYSPNNVLAQSLFDLVYDKDVTIHSHAIMLAEEQMALETWDHNAWLYLLLGDPEMTIRRRPPGDLALLAPASVPVCSDPPCWLDAQVMDDQGQPLPELIVSAWMPTPPPVVGGDSGSSGGWNKQPPPGGVQCNRYSDEEGKVRLPAEPGGGGWILLTARDDFGRVITDSVQVIAGTATPPPHLPLMMSPRPGVMSERTTFYFGRGLETPCRLEVYDTRGRLVRRLRGERGLDRVLWDGRDGTGQPVGSGVYLVRLIAEGQRISTKVVRVR